MLSVTWTKWFSKSEKPFFLSMCFVYFFKGRFYHRHSKQPARPLLRDALGKFHGGVWGHVGMCGGRLGVQQVTDALWAQEAAPPRSFLACSSGQGAWAPRPTTWRAGGCQGQAVCFCSGLSICKVLITSVLFVRMVPEELGQQSPGAVQWMMSH